MKLLELLAIPVGFAIVRSITKNIEDKTTQEPLVTPAPVTPDPPIVPLIPTGPATPAKPITPFITVKQRAEQAAFIARQAKLKRDQLLGRFGL
jgi:hypothetical protein|tara:strand:- start:773 stop:1051 length:279 start_codon:yes stop_codon:yes gene_type:complete